MTTDKPKSPKLVTLQPKSDVDRKEHLKQGRETLETMITDDTKSFFLLSFDSDDNPQVLWAGEIDYMYMIAALEIAKTDFMQRVTDVSD